MKRSSFYVGFSVLVAAIVALGFLPTLNAKLLHPPVPRPPILYLHAMLFFAWVLLVIAQATLVYSGRVRSHRRLGLFGIAVGALIPVIGFGTALTITRLQWLAGDPNAEQSLIVPIFDMIAFTLLFALAIHWRRRPEYHRRLILLASSGLTVAAFARFPSWLVPDNAFYIAVDVLICTAVSWDWTKTRHLHPVYRYAVPLLITGQALTMWISLSGWLGWRLIARALLRL